MSVSTSVASIRKLNTAEDKIIRAKNSLYKNFPFFSYLVEHMIFQPVEGTYLEKMVPTIGVNAAALCSYNSQFLMDTDKEYVHGILAHEVMHLALRHHSRIGSRQVMLTDPSGQKVYLWNIAGDIVINEALISNGIKLPQEAWLPNNHQIDVFGYRLVDVDKKSTEEIYDELLHHLKQQTQQNQGKSGSGKGMSVSGMGNDPGSEENPYKSNDPIKGFDKHFWDDKNTPKGKERGDTTQDGGTPEFGEDSDPVQWDSKLAEAKEFSVKRGVTPAGMAREFEIVSSHKLNLDAFLRKEIGRFIPMDYTFNRPNKSLISQGIFMPSTYGEHIKILFSIDTSGSVSREDLSKILSIIVNISKSHALNVEFRILTHDVEVHDDYHIYNGNIEKVKRIQVHGGGGTSHKPLYEYIRANKLTREAKVLISFTDGFSDFPDREPRGLKSVFVLVGYPVADKTSMPRWGTTIVYNR